MLTLDDLQPSKQESYIEAWQAGGDSHLEYREEAYIAECMGRQWLVKCKTDGMYDFSDDYYSLCLNEGGVEQLIHWPDA